MIWMKDVVRVMRYILRMWDVGRMERGDFETVISIIVTFSLATQYIIYIGVQLKSIRRILIHVYWQRTKEYFET
jgi:hypothetical protein